MCIRDRNMSQKSIFSLTNQQDMQFQLSKNISMHTPGRQCFAQPTQYLTITDKFLRAWDAQDLTRMRIRKVQKRGEQIMKDRIQEQKNKQQENIEKKQFGLVQKIQNQVDLIKCNWLLLIKLILLGYRSYKHIINTQRNIKCEMLNTALVEIRVLRVMRNLKSEIDPYGQNKIERNLCRTKLSLNLICKMELKRSCKAKAQQIAVDFFRESVLLIHLQRKFIDLHKALKKYIYQFKSLATFKKNFIEDIAKLYVTKFPLILQDLQFQYYQLQFPNTTIEEFKKLRFKKDIKPTDGDMVSKIIKRYFTKIADRFQIRATEYLELKKKFIEQSKKQFLKGHHITQQLQTEFPVYIMIMRPYLFIPPNYETLTQMVKEYIQEKNLHFSSPLNQ
eukprot:TRINITY_DN4073_c0_g1_i1.p1 TRINITY_DN4073_c0_g1~~TRINITY_DN4073_c0_g1_i1.p1  ORF type:complete len:390 (-),score=43.22 TRINITY_DN4073_c0_g1_i1:280-1449(-)